MLPVGTHIVRFGKTPVGDSKGEGVEMIGEIYEFVPAHYWHGTWFPNCYRIYFPGLYNTTWKILVLVPCQDVVEVNTVFTFSKVKACKKGSLYDLVCFANGVPLAYMVMVDGHLQSNDVHHYGSPYSKRNPTCKESEGRLRTIKKYEDEIRRGCISVK